MSGTTTGRRYGVNAGAAIKVPCEVSSTTNVTLSGEQTIDGVSVVEDDRVFLKNQTDPIENGIWDVSTGSWRRAPDFDGIADVVEGTLIFVNNGTVGAQTMWRVTNTGDITPGTTALTFSVAAIGGIGTTTDNVNHSSGLAIQTTETVQSRFNRILYITDFIGVDPTGATDSTAGITLARNYIASLSNPVKLIWPAGIYSYSVSPNWAITKLEMESAGDVRLRYTGSGNALIFDGGTGLGVYDIRAGRFYIESPAAAGHGVYMRAVFHGKFDFNVRGCGVAAAGLKTEWCVLNEIRYTCSVNEGAWYSTTAPLYGIHSSDSAGTKSAYNKYINPIVEGCDTGIYLENCTGEQFDSGASEGNTTIGLKISSGANLNVINGMDFESNAGGLPSGYDVEVGGAQNMFTNIASDSMFKIISGARFNRVNSSSFFNIEVESGATLNFFNQCAYNRQGVLVGTYTDNGTNTMTRDLIDVLNVGVIGALGRATYDNELTTTSLVVGASPWTYQNTSGQKEAILITGGFLSEVLFSRTDVGGKTTRYEEGPSGDALGSSLFELSPTDSIRVTYDAGFPPQAYKYTR